MAGTLTHYKIAEEVLNRTKIPLDKEVYFLASQGHDLLYFIKLKDLPTFKEVKEQCKLIQKKKFYELVKTYLKELDNEFSLVVKSFLYGYITHHIVDSIFHPFIIYETGIYKNTKETKKYQGNHERLESMIDVLLTKDVHRFYKKVPKLKNTKKLKEVTQKVFKEVYDREDIGQALIKNMNNVRSFLRIYRTDIFKIKKLGYKVVDKITGKYYEFLSFNYSKKDLDQIDLKAKMKWHHPQDNEQMKASILDLYEQSIEKTLKTLDNIEKGNIKEEDLDISSTTGKSSKIKETLCYFRN